jgi:hypothetical protein
MTSVDVTMTVGEFFKNCSTDEVRELEQLLDSVKQNSGNSDNSEKFRDALESLQSSMPQTLFDSMTSLFGDHLDEAIEICSNIRSRYGITWEESVKLMKPFRDLEKLRVKSLVGSPQEQNKEQHGRI